MKVLKIPEIHPTVLDIIYCIGYNILYWSNTDILQIQSSSWCMRQKSFLIEFIHILRIGPIRLNGIFVGIIHTVDTIYTVTSS